LTRFVPPKDDARTEEAPVQITITGRSLLRGLLALLVAAAVVWGGVATYLLLTSGDGFSDQIDPERYQAVFLQNGQVYFGHLEDAGDFLRLRQAFFIEEVPPPEEEDEPQPPTRQVRPVTEEFHQPEGSIFFPKETVLRVDNLSPESEVALAIDRVLTGEA
jgi:hypothetical protein